MFVSDSISKQKSLSTSTHPRAWESRWTDTGTSAKGKPEMMSLHWAEHGLTAIFYIARKRKLSENVEKP